MTRLDLIIPVFDEEEVLPLLFLRLKDVFTKNALQKQGIDEVRYLFVDDGSKDETARIITEYIEGGAPAVLVRLSRNFGHQNAVSAGLQHADADVVAIIDADLQDPPEVILEMLSLWQRGFEVVYGQRRRRKENWLKVFCYWFFYRLLSFLSEIEIAMDSGDFSLLDRTVVDALNALPETLRFPRGLRSWIGFRQIGYEYDRPGRPAGRSKYAFRELYKLATDGIAATSIRPLKITQLTSFLFALLSVGFSALSVVAYTHPHRLPVPVHLSFLIGYFLISLTGFVISGSLYVICAYLGRMYLEVKHRPSFIVREIIKKQAPATRKRRAA